MYSLNATQIKRPQQMTEDNNTQVAQVRTLGGSVNRDYFGSNKRIWSLEYKTIKKTDFDTINTLYQLYLSTGNSQPFICTETNYSIASTNVHVDLLTRGFSYRGDQYLSDFTLILTEA